MDSVETWIDALAARWEISDGRGGAVRSLRVFEKNELPAAITSEMIPCAVTYPVDVEPQYSQGGPTLLFWTGRTEFHLTKDVKPANIPYILPFYSRILIAAAASMKLGGLVSYFAILEQKGAIQYFIYQNNLGQDDHQGIVVQWMVKQDISGQLTVNQ